MPADREAVIAQIVHAFGENPYPGDVVLQGSFEGCEPFDEVGPFQGLLTWQEIAPALLDAHGAALSFFSEVGFRFFLPAFLLADLRDQLQYADPLFHLTHGFYDFTVTIEKPPRTFTIASGKSRLLNPRRYGAITAGDYARFRLSVFTREEVVALIAYLEYKRAVDESQCDTAHIDAALQLFWRERAHSAPTAASLQRQLAEEAEYDAAIRTDFGLDEHAG